MKRWAPVFHRLCSTIVRNFALRSLPLIVVAGLVGQNNCPKSDGSLTTKNTVCHHRACRKTGAREHCADCYISYPFISVFLVCTSFLFSNTFIIIIIIMIIIVGNVSRHFSLGPCYTVSSAVPMQCPNPKHTRVQGVQHSPSPGHGSPMRGAGLARSAWAEAIWAWESQGSGPR